MRGRLGILVAWLAVFFNLPGAHGEPDSSECTEYNNLSAFVGQDVVLWEKVPPTEILYITLENSRLFEFIYGNLTKSCTKCIGKNSSAVLKNVQLNESGMVMVKIINGCTVCRNLTVTVPPSTTSGPKVPPSDPKESSDIKGSINTAAVICGTLVAAAAVVALFIYYYWQEIKSRFQNIFRGRTNCERSVSYMECNGRENGTTLTNNSNLSIPSHKDEGTDLHSGNQGDIVIAVQNGETRNPNGTSTDPSPIPGPEQNVATRSHIST